MTTSDSPQTPLRPVEFYILLALARGASHGYGIIQATEEQSDGRVSLDPGTLYRALARMKDDGLIEEADRREAEDLQDRRRRYYRLTPSGRELAAAEADRLAGLVRAAEAAELLDEPGTAR